MSVTCLRSTVAALPRPPAEGDRVVVHGKYDFWAARGQLNFKVDEIHPVGLGELLLRLERTRKLLAAEGLSDPERKRPLPFLPRCVGLITGRASAAESDVLANARARWPAVRFRVAYAAVQGVSAVPQILDALALLDADPQVDVIVLARGGGSAEDLLPFSDEALCRAVARCRTPVVAAVGHEPDHPIVDDVADVRCSTPTDAGKRVVPDAAAELRAVDGLRSRARRALAGWVRTEHAHLARLTAATVLADPHAPLERRAEQIERLVLRSRAQIVAALDRWTEIWPTVAPSSPHSARPRRWPGAIPWSRPAVTSCDRWPTHRPARTCASGWPMARSWPSAAARNPPAVHGPRSPRQPTDQARPPHRAGASGRQVRDRPGQRRAGSDGHAHRRHQLRAGQGRTRRGGGEAGGRRAQPGRFADPVGAGRASGPGVRAVPGRRTRTRGRRAGRRRGGRRH